MVRDLVDQSAPRHHLFSGNKGGSSLQAKMSSMYHRVPDLSDQFTKATSCLAEFTNFEQVSMVIAQRCMFARRPDNLILERRSMNTTCDFVVETFL